MTLTQAIAKVPNWEDLLTAELTALVNAKTVQKRTLGEINIAHIADEISEQAAALVLYTLEQAIEQSGPTPEASLYRSFLTKLSASLVDMTNEKIRAQVVALGADWPEGLLDQVLALGYVMTNWQGFDATEAQVGKAVASMKLEARKKQLREQFASEFNEGLAYLETWNGSGQVPRLVFFDGVAD